MIFYGYVDYTNDGRPFYVGIGNERRLKVTIRNTKHKGISRVHGFERRTEFTSDDWTACQQWEVSMIAELKTFHYDDVTGIGCNFTRGGDGVVGYKHSPEALQKCKAPHVGRKQSLETIAKRAASLRLVERGPQSPEHVAKRLSALRGKKASPEAVAKRTASRKAFYERKRMQGGT